MGLVQSLIDDGLVSEKEVASTVLGAINPPQVGTSIASKASFQQQFAPRKCWVAVKGWFYGETGRCIDCGTRLNLEADHIISRRDGGVDSLDNLGLRCRRHNSSRRHANGGVADLTTQAALMFVLLTNRPKSYKEYEVLCREYGLTCSSIRIQEAYALAIWLRREKDARVQ